MLQAVAEEPHCAGEHHCVQGHAAALVIPASLGYLRRPPLQHRRDRRGGGQRKGQEDGERYLGQHQRVRSGVQPDGTKPTRDGRRGQ